MDETQEIETLGINPCPEIPRIGIGETAIFFQRHGRYDNRRPTDENNLTAEAKQSFGRLTPDGKTEVADITDKRLQVIFGKDPTRVDVWVVSSPTYWLDIKEFGQRAVETGEVISSRVIDYLVSSGLSPDQLLNTRARSDSVPVSRHGLTQQEELLGEGRLFQVLEFANYLREKYGGQGPEFWKNYFADTDELVRREMQAEGPADAAARLGRVMDIEARYARIYHHFNPDRELFIWNVTHGDGLTPFAERVIRLPRGSFEADYNAGIGVKIDQSGNATSEVAGKIYPISIYQKGQKQSPLSYN